VVLLSCAKSGNVEVLKEVTGPGETNCYLVYDSASKEAAIIDVGGEVPGLVKTIREKGLNLKYIFATHGHMDHMEGTPAIRERFPDALFCISRADYEDFLVHREWAMEHMDPSEIDAMRQHPGYSKWFEYDLETFEAPDVYLQDGQVLRLGELEMRTIHSPGHSRGSMCFHVGSALFSGDVLFYRQVGHTGFMYGSMEDLTASVRRLYDMLPEDTQVYPGHGETTDIGSEKAENEVIRAAS
jgi:glyoxylase-like metal-dependent hydrolase (beta-lactamase superfamily II)